MNLPVENSLVPIHCYKHNGAIHRKWGKSMVLSASEEVIVVANDKTVVREASGRTWTTREPALCVFFPNEWYNIIIMMKDVGTAYYVNIASPVVFDEDALKYIDYDLDVKLMHDGKIKVLDKGEFQKHQEKYGYPVEIIKQAEKQVDLIKKQMVSKEGFYDPKVVETYMKKWREMKKA